MKRKEIVILVCVLLVQLLLIAYFVRYRIVDKDEGFYLFAAREVSFGKTPYADFFFPQMPLILYLLAPVCHFGWKSLFLGRLAYGTASLALGLLMFWYVYRWGRSFSAAIAALLLYVLNGFLLSWHTVIQFNAIADLLSFSAFLCLIGRFDSRRKVWCFLSGLLLGVTVSFRIVFLPLVPLFLFLLYLLRERQGVGEVSRDLSLYLGGALVGASLLIYHWARQNPGFLYQTVVFQLSRQRFFAEGQGLWSSVRHNLITLGKFFLFPQTGFIVLLSAVALVVRGRRLEGREPFLRSHPRESALLLIALTIFVSHLFATPLIFHYFVQVIPPLIAFSAPLLPTLFRRRRLARVWAGAGALYLASIAVPVGLHVKALMPKYRAWQVENVRRVVERVQEITRRDDEVISYWAGILVLSQRRGIEGVAPWERAIADRVTEAQRQKYALASGASLLESILEKRPRLIVAPTGLRDDTGHAIEECYEKREEFEGFVIYTRKGAGI